ncbi:antitoxin [Streptacidiphilus fuscans]|uniref:Antitoxin n=1 Tax=Streptacidiphilus fuscans TaxID=2789292 RepID=A0A931BBF8_9ACTN|nr:antitoxin [Streptacidiphilus fuscans]MBF9073588.1 antitoxin [Streptacidiphilus fuscans]
MSVLDKVKGMLHGHESQAGKGVDKAGDMIDQKTGGKYQSQVDTAQNQAKKQMGVDGQAQEPPVDGGQSA